MPQDSERRLQNLPRQGNPLPFPFRIITNLERVGEIVDFANDFAIAVELVAAGAVGGAAGPGGGELAEVKLGPGGHVGDLGEEGVERDADDGGALGGFDAELGF